MTHAAASDVVIIGAGVMGCATAVHLLRDEPSLRVSIIEPDTGFTLAATIDLTRMEYKRILDNVPYPETGIR